VGVLGRALGVRHLARLSIVLAMLLTGLAAFSPLAARPVAAQDDQRNPRDIATTDDEAGKLVTVEADEDGSDDYGVWTHRRWSRDRESSDLHVGPVLIDNKVWISPNLDTARALYKSQVDKMKEFPERDVNQDSAKGPFAFTVTEGLKPSDLAEDAAALSACVDCDVKTVILTHRRIVLRRLNVVTVMYIFGRENVATPELAVWFARQVSLRMI
jgi:hypothetical protein